MHKKSLAAQEATKRRLKKSGITLLIIGGLLFWITLFMFIFGNTTLFFLFFIALPLLFLGAVLSMFGFFGDAVRYQASQVAPVAKDTINYMVNGTADAVTKLAKEIKHGGKIIESCDYCGEDVEKDAKFCSSCGKSLTRACPSCDHINAHDARFCSACGYKLI